MRLSWLLLVAACGTTAAPAAPAPDLDSIPLGPAAGWPDSVAVRSVPATFQTTVTGLEVDPAGKVWLLRDEVADPSQLLGTPVLERYALTGPLEKRITFPPHALVSSFVVHPSGELSVFVMRDDDGDMLDYGLHILRLSPDGETLADVPFEETPGPRENLFYDGSGVHEIAVKGPFSLAWTSHVVGLPDGEGLFLLAEWTLSFKLYRLDAGYQRVWGAQVMPANIGNAFAFSPSLLARDGDAVYAATQIFEDDVPIYGEHFARPALTPIGTYDMLVQRFDGDGTFSAARLFGGVGIDHGSAMTVHAGNVLIAGAARVTKHDDPNRTMEWDLAVSRGRVEDASSGDYRTIDLSRDDFGWALAEAPDGSLTIGGRTDFVQVDTNSEVENGKGLLLTLSADLSTQSAVELVGPRDVQVRALRRLADGRLVFAGMRDGPLTHTDKSMTNNDGVWGIARAAE